MYPFYNKANRSGPTHSIHPGTKLCSIRQSVIPGAFCHFCNLTKLYHKRVSDNWLAFFMNIEFKPVAHYASSTSDVSHLLTFTRSIYPGPYAPYNNTPFSFIKTVALSWICFKALLYGNFASLILIWDERMLCSHFYNWKKNQCESKQN